MTLWKSDVHRRRTMAERFIVIQIQRYQPHCHCIESSSKRIETTTQYTTSTTSILLENETLARLHPPLGSHCLRPVIPAALHRHFVAGSIQMRHLRLRRHHHRLRRRRPRSRPPLPLPIPHHCRLFRKRRRRHLRQPRLRPLEGAAGGEWTGARDAE